MEITSFDRNGVPYLAFDNYIVQLIKLDPVRYNKYIAQHAGKNNWMPVPGYRIILKAESDPAMLSECVDLYLNKIIIPNDKRLKQYKI